ncbi:transcriptional regulator family: Zinc finger MIZ-type [Penicillium sp. IBT 18751x]|nr:transcriptional regulator family: Zinc finger MIZ-type [Penicillium sp. IBT 18751x]
MASSGQSSEITHLVALIKTLTNPQLKDLLRNEGLAVSGVKISLQLRIIDYLERLANSEGNSARYDALRRLIFHTAVPGASTFQANTAFQLQNPTVSHQAPSQARSTPLGASMSPHSHTGHLTFKESPFFTIVTHLTPIVECKVREQTRDSVELKVNFSASTAADLQTDPNLRVMVYCAADSGLKQYTKSDIAFPHQVELKANLDEVKANLRGLKNRPGTTQPADVTNYMRKKPGYTNNIVMTYALTQKKFFALVNLVRQHPVADLVAELKSRKLISKDQVLREMKNRAEDSDIVATSSIMSLKCPLSTLRIEVPCRSVVCTHNQCFDASSFLELQKQAPTWTCPVCSKSTSFESLQIDQYVDDILRETLPDVEQVVIEPDGAWSNPNDADGGKLGGVTPATDDDDLIEITEPGISPVKQEPMSSNVMLERTPAQSQSQSREASTPSSAVRMSKKRPAAQVIDLTASDEEEDESPAPMPKRPALSFSVREDTHQPVTGSPLHNGTYPPPYQSG